MADSNTEENNNVSYDQELAFIGSCIMFEEIFAMYSSDIDRSFFEDKNHRLIWDTMKTFSNEGIEITADNLALECDMDKSELMSIAQESVADDAYISHLKDALIERKRVNDLQFAIQKELNSGASSDDIIHNLGSIIDGLPQNVNLEDNSSAAIVKKALENYERTKAGDLIVERYSTGLPDLDAALGGGIAPERLYVVGARPSIGKTSLAVQLFHNVLDAAGEECTGLFVSLEMTEQSLIRKQLSMISGIPSREIETAQIPNEDLDRFSKAAAKLGDDMNFAAISDPKLTAEKIISVARQWERKSQRKMVLIVVDYIQKIGTIPGKDERESVNHLMETLRRYSLTDNVAVIACSQLGRDIDNRSDKRPTSLSDLKGSGNIEQDADVAMTLYRDDYYYGEDSTDVGGADIFIIKNRWGATADLNFSWLGELTMFGDKSIKEMAAGLTDTDEF